MNSLDTMMGMVHAVNLDNGWFDDSRSFGDDIALLHSEVSEMLEAYRDMGVDNKVVDGKPEGIGSEAADVLIRLLDTCYRWGINLERDFETKLAYNVTRGYKHGGKKL